jgi:hypothetical protein
VGSFKYTELRASARIEALFSRPILDWTGVPSRFNLMVYDALANKVPINPAELSVHGNTVLGEVYAKYNIYGGATSVSLYADKLAFDFPNLIPSDRPLVEQVIASIHDGFPITFPELSYRRMKISSFEHLDLSNANAVDAFLNRFRLPHAESLSSAVVVHPGAKFKAILQDQNWECDFSAERSALSATAVFTALTGGSPVWVSNPVCLHVGSSSKHSRRNRARSLAA